MSVTMYLLYDKELKFAMKDERSQFKKVDETTVLGCDNGSQINWKVSSCDDQIKMIKIKPKKGIKGKKPVRGKWKDVWREKPKNISKTHCQGCPDCSGATEKEPQIFAFDITFKIKGAKDEVTIDPGVWIPNPAEDPPFENDADQN